MKQKKNNKICFLATLTLGGVFLFSFFFLEESTFAIHTPPAGDLSSWCSEVRQVFHQFHWKLDPCEGIQWKIGGKSVRGRPLVYSEFGDLRSENTTLVFSMVHGDEVTPLYVAIQLAQLVKKQPLQMAQTRVVIAPLVNPDGFFNQPRTRVNANGVDVNRNFATEDWDTHAIQLWKKKFRSNPRRYPGQRARSEPETLFQEELIQRILPQKILSIHSPLDMTDYDGPGSIRMPHLPFSYVQECEKLRKRLKAISGGLFPGSLGNYAGHRGIPTITAELRSADSAQAEHYWKQVQKWVHTLIGFQVPRYASENSQTGSGS